MSTTSTGNLTRDPEVRFAGSKPVVSLAIAVTKKKGDEEYTSYFDVEAWGTLATNAADSLVKGNRVVIHGVLSQERYETKDGQKRDRVRLVADSIGAELRFASVAITRNERSEGGFTAKPSPSSDPF